MQVACFLKLFVLTIYIEFSTIRATDQLINLDLMIITRLGEELTFIKLLIMQFSPAFYYCFNIRSKKASSTFAHNWQHINIWRNTGYAISTWMQYETSHC
jgi:hypothetical protein